MWHMFQKWSVVFPLSVMKDLETRLQVSVAEKVSLKAEQEDLLLLLSEQDSQLAELSQGQVKQEDGRSLANGAPAVQVIMLLE